MFFSSSLAPRVNAGPVDIVVLTTAALPWRTGPAIFSLWHAGGLAALGYRVAYGVPWLDASSQKRLWGEVLFANPDEQAQWLRAEALRLGVPSLPDIFFFKGVFSKSLFSIFIVEDAFAAAPPARYFLVQEPEHFGWLPFHSAKHRLGVEKILGIVMTNYGSYIRRPGRPDRAAFAKVVEWRHKQLMRKHADVIVPLSPAIDLKGVEDLVTWQQVTGVLKAFTQVPPVAEGNDRVYFLGRLTWDKGLECVIDVAKRMGVTIDVYGDGPDNAAIQKSATDKQSPVRFLGPSSSPWEVMEEYRVFFNPSLSEVLCTTTAEALVAGRHVVLPNCPANQPFFDLPNVHVYDTPDHADAALRVAMAAAVVPPIKAQERFDWATVCRLVAELLVA
jgi:digalactosyldiacylglycerol synthase